MREIKAGINDDKSGGKKIEIKRQGKKNNLGFDAPQVLFQILGINLAEIPGINATTILTIVSEIGTSLDKWPTAKRFASWLGLCPGTKISGGKRLGGKTKYSKNRVAEALRMAASTLNKSDMLSYLRENSQ